MTEIPAIRKPASIKDVARLAGVSHSTVSRALRNSPRVNSETTEKIRRIAAESGYRTSAVARSLATRRTNTIGVVVTTITDLFAAEVVSGIEEAAGERDYSILLANCNADPEREMRVVRTMEERRVDGIVVTASRVGALYIPMLSRMRVPIVLLNNQHPSEFAHSVMIANTEASLAAMQHLIHLGHRRIGYIGDRNGRQSDTERFAGYRYGLDAADVPFEPELVFHGDGNPEGGMQGVVRLLSLSSPPTAIFCYDDMTALGALRQIRMQGLHVPRDISLIGFDDLAIVGYTDPPLTTVRQPMARMGRMAMETLFDILAGSRSNHNLKVPGELVVRESTAPPRASPNQPAFGRTKEKREPA
jgi:DNA-binding LacI/PurR family transcriptional regulator